MLKSRRTTQRLGGILASHVKTQAGRTQLPAKVLTADTFVSGDGSFMRLLKTLCLTLFLVSVSLLLFHDQAAIAHDQPSRIGERPTLEEHVKQFDLEFGRIRFDD